MEDGPLSVVEGERRQHRVLQVPYHLLLLQMIVRTPAKQSDSQTALCHCELQVPQNLLVSQMIVRTPDRQPDGLPSLCAAESIQYWSATWNWSTIRDHLVAGLGRIRV